MKAFSLEGEMSKEVLLLNWSRIIEQFDSEFSACVSKADIKVSLQVLGFLLYPCSDNYYCRFTSTMSPTDSD
jgi:hypothetical protein